MAPIKNWFSNMTILERPIVFQDIEYNSVENFYQAMKLCDEDLENRKYIASLPPQKSKTEIRKSSKYVIRPEWDRDFKLSTMECAIRLKFINIPKWRELLMESITNPDDRDGIVEYNNWNDQFWGKTVDDKVGQNHLGDILTHLRTFLINESQMEGLMGLVYFYKYPKFMMNYHTKQIKPPFIKW